MQLYYSVSWILFFFFKTHSTLCKIWQWNLYQFVVKLLSCSRYYLFVCNYLIRFQNIIIIIQKPVTCLEVNAWATPFEVIIQLVSKWLQLSRHGCQLTACEVPYKLEQPHEAAAAAIPCFMLTKAADRYQTWRINT